MSLIAYAAGVMMGYWLGVVADDQLFGAILVTVISAFVVVALYRRAPARPPR